VNELTRSLNHCADQGRARAKERGRAPDGHLDPPPPAAIGTAFPGCTAAEVFSSTLQANRAHRDPYEFVRSGSCTIGIFAKFSVASRRTGDWGLCTSPQAPHSVPRVLLFFVLAGFFRVPPFCQNCLYKWIVQNRSGKGACVGHAVIPACPTPKLPVPCLVRCGFVLRITTVITSNNVCFSLIFFFLSMYKAELIEVLANMRG